MFKIKITSVLTIIIALLTMGLMDIEETSSAYAFSNDTEFTTSTVVVNGLVSITLTGVPIQFSALDPGTTFQAANASGGSPTTVTVDAATNVAVNIYLNASNFTSGSNVMTMGNMSFNVTTPSGGAANASCGTAHSCVYLSSRVWIFNDTARLGSSNVGTISNYISVPAAQVPGTYTNAVNICATQVGVSGC